MRGRGKPSPGGTIPQAPPPKRHPYDQWSPDARALDLVGDKWTLLIVRDLAAGPRRFVELQRGLPGISTEQLRSRLNRMVADGLLTRQRYREVPPRVDYDLTERSRALLPALRSRTPTDSRPTTPSPPPEPQPPQPPRLPLRVAGGPDLGDLAVHRARRPSHPAGLHAARRRVLAAGVAAVPGGEREAAREFP